MRLTETLPLAVRALFRNKARSFLTTLGVIIGVASVISMVTVGEGAKARVESVFASMGTNLLIVLSGSTRGGGVMGGFGSMPTLTWDDLEAIRKHAPAVRAASPQLSTRTTIIADDANWTTNVSGVNADYFEIRAWGAARGSLLADADVSTGNKVLVLGQTASDALFGPGVSPIGKSVRIRSVPFQVIGVLDRKGQSPMGHDLDDIALVPHTTFQAKLQGGLGKFVPGVIAVSAISPDDTGRAEEQIRSLLRERHRLGRDDPDDFDVRNLTEIANAQKEGTGALTSLLAAIAVVSLVVGGIGIMNIMLVSVTERTREIGLRMAVGAKPWHVLAQFLVEAVTLSTAGGFLGIGIGWFVARFVAVRFGYPFTMPLDMMLVAFGFSVLVGIAFGLYPAQKAAKLEPIDALRYE